MKIISLAENTCKSGLYGTEHGLSLYIETEKHKILFDMGQSELFCENAKENHDNIKFCKLNVDEDKNEISKDFGVMSIPTVIAFKNGKEVKRNIGFMNSDDLDNFIGDI